VHPVGADLTNNIDTVVCHAMHDLFELFEVVGALGQFVGIDRGVHHPTVHPDLTRSNAQEIGWRGIKVMRRARKADLVREEFVVRISPVSRLRVRRHVATVAEID